MDLPTFLKQHRTGILSIAAKYGAQNIRVFGSMARGEDTPQSDVDLLVEFEDSRSLLDMGGMLCELEKLLGRKVDLVEPDGLHRLIKARVLAEAVPV